MQGKLRLVGSYAAEGQEESEVLRLAAAVEGSTRHPLADAVLLAARKAHLQVPTSLPLTRPTAPAWRCSYSTTQALLSSLSSAATSS